MALHRISIDIFSGLRHLHTVSRDAPKSRSGFEAARRRAEDIVCAFELSREAATLPDGQRWTSLILRTAYVHHGVTVDDLSREILCAVAARCVVPNDPSSLAHWIEVIHDELVAFFRFLDRKGFAHAARCICALENEIRPRYDALLKDAAMEGVTPISFGIAQTEPM